MAEQRAATQLRQLSFGALCRRCRARVGAWTHRRRTRCSTLPADRETEGGRKILEPCSYRCWRFFEGRFDFGVVDETSHPRDGFIRSSYFIAGRCFARIALIGRSRLKSVTQRSSVSRISPITSHIRFLEATAAATSSGSKRDAIALATSSLCQECWSFQN